jgi:hypothetical protein
VKRSLLTDAAGVPLAIGVRERTGLTSPWPWTRSMTSWCRAPSPAWSSPKELCLDKGYDAFWLRWEVLRRQYHPHIWTRGEEAKTCVPNPVRKPAASRSSGPIAGSTTFAACSFAGKS